MRLFFRGLLRREQVASNAPRLVAPAKRARLVGSRNIYKALEDRVTA
jgi:hypothetical protein